MATLTQASIVSKKFLLFLVIISVLGFMLLLILMISEPLRKSLLGPGPVATVAFGKLPRLTISGFKPSSGVSYSVETVSGDLGEVVQFAKVLSIEVPRHSFGDIERIKGQAAKAGFNNPPFLISQDTVKFIDPKNEQRVLTVGTATGDLSLVSNWASDQKIINSTVKNIDGVKNRAKAFISAFGIYKDEFPDNKIEIKMYRIVGPNLIETQAISQANLVKVIFGREGIDKLPVMPEVEGEAQIWVTVSENDIVAAEINIFKIQRFRFASYPLKSVKGAFEELKIQKGVFNKTVEQEKIVIRGVSLGYLEGKNTRDYLQPVYVFRSDNNLLAYVPAVDEGWIQ